VFISPFHWTNLHFLEWHIKAQAPFETPERGTRHRKRTNRCAHDVYRILLESTGKRASGVRVSTSSGRTVSCFLRYRQSPLNRRHASVLDWRYSTRKTDLPIGNQDLERTFWRRRWITLLSHGEARSLMSFSCDNNENLEWLCNSVKLNSDNNFVLS
jgi:hypothetical protein